MVINEVRKIAERLQFNEDVFSFSQYGNTFSCFSKNFMPAYMINKHVTVIDGNNVNTNVVVKAISGRTFDLIMPVGWTALNFKVHSFCPKFYSGTITDLVKQFKNDSKDLNKFPFIALVLNINETESNDVVDADLRLLIGNLTQQKYTNPERESNFIILRSIADQLKSEINKGTSIILGNEHEFKFVEDNLLGELSNIFQDYIDAIELKVNIKYIKNC